MSASRLSAIEEKRAKLEELRRQRKTRIVSASFENSSSLNLSPKQTSVSSLDEHKPHYVSVSISTDDSTPKRELVTYDKGTQTLDEEWDFIRILKPETKKVEEEEDIVDPTSLIKSEEELPKLESEEDEAPLISEKVFNEDKLAEFVGRSLKIVDRSLLSDFNILQDYQNMTMADYEDTSLADDPILLNCTLFLDIIDGKSVTSLDWSPFSPNLLAASYSSLPPQQYHKGQDKGLIIIWNIKTQRPEFIFTSTTEILTVKFALHKKTVLFAGGYNGKILQYDITSDSKFPIAQSPLSSRLDTHSHPVYSLLQINKTTTGAGNLVSCSTDGKICQWSPFLLDKPLSTPLQLKTSFSRYDEDLINSMLRLSNGSLLLGGHSLTVLENFQMRNNFKPFDANFKNIVTGMAQFPDHKNYHDLILCSSVDSIVMYNEMGEKLREFSTSSIVMDISWLNAETFIVATGISLELFDISKISSYSFFESPTNEYINKVSANDEWISVGTENGNILLYKYVK